MKKIILTLILIFTISNCLFSQARLFYSEEEIRDEFNFLNWHTSYAEDTYLKMIKAEWNDIVILHGFNSYNQCIMSMVFPKTNKELYDRIKKYNLQNTLLEENHWIEPSGIHIELVPSDGGLVFFYWK